MVLGSWVEMCPGDVVDRQGVPCYKVVGEATYEDAMRQVAILQEMAGARITVPQRPPYFYKVVPDGVVQ